MKIAKNCTGFTLLEVLVALVIVGTALGASLRAVGSLIQNSNDMRSAMMATWSAENRLMQIRLERDYPPTGERTFNCPQSNLNFMCKETIKASLNPNFRVVEVVVFDAERPERQLVKLNQLVSNSRS